MSLKSKINQLLDWRMERKMWQIGEHREKNALLSNGFKPGKAPGEDEYIAKWSKILRFPAPNAYRLFSNFCGPTPDILSESATKIINDTLNPLQFQIYYSDKNTFDRVFPANAMPRTFLRRINGITLNADYENVAPTDQMIRNLLANVPTVVLKPTVDSDSGRGVVLFHNKNGRYFSKDGRELTAEFFESYGRNLILQQGVKQHPVLSALNPESVNTIRIATYKSVKDGQVHILSCVIRMGNAGSEIDNLHAGGHMILIDENGNSASFCNDQYGHRFSRHNDLDFTKYKFQLPNYNGVKEFCKSIARSMPELHLLQHDITIDEQGRPLCIEVNSKGFSSWIIQYMGFPALGPYTDEIIDYVSRNHAHNHQVIVL